MDERHLEVWLDPVVHLAPARPAVRLADLEVLDDRPLGADHRAVVPAHGHFAGQHGEAVLGGVVEGRPVEELAGEPAQVRRRPMVHWPQPRRYYHFVNYRWTEREGMMMSSKRVAASAAGLTPILSSLLLSASLAPAVLGATANPCEPGETWLQPTAVEKQADGGQLDD